MVEVLPAPGACPTFLESPRRTLRDISAARGDREALREQRRLQIEKQLREQMGFGEDGRIGGCASSADWRPATGRASSPSSSSTCRASREQRLRDTEQQLSSRLGLQADAREVNTSPREVHGLGASVDVDGSGHFASRPSSARRTGASGSVGGPARPPKPKPYRPLSFEEGERAAVEVRQPTQRWKSALLPVWPDRETVSFGGPRAEVEPSPRGSSPPHMAQTLPASTDLRHISDRYPPGVAAASLDLSPRPVPRGQESRVALAGAHVQEVPVPAGSPRPRPVVEACVPIALPDKPRAAAAKADGLGAAAASAARLLLEEQQHAERARLMEESALRLRENAQRLRSENRRSRLFGTTGAACATDSSESTVDVDAGSSQTREVVVPEGTARRLEEMRRKIAELDEVNALERERLEQEQRAMEERRRQQAEFERNLQERTERDLQSHREREAWEAEARTLREETERRELEERTRRRKEQLQQEEERSKQLEDKRREARSDAAQMKWQGIEEELDRQWAEQEAEEKRKAGEYAAARRKQYQEWDRKLVGERQRFASAAEFRDAAHHQKARNAAQADEQFYGPRRARSMGESPRGSAPPQRPAARPPPPPAVSGPELKNLCSEEVAVLKGLQSVQGASRDVQKAKVKELLFRWHPDKNPSCAEKATRIFQFVQKQRESVLGL